MFYCEPCRITRDWPESLMRSYGVCEVCGAKRECNDMASRQLPLPKGFSKLEDPRRPVRKVQAPPVQPKDRIDQFLSLFSEAERASWAGKGNKAPGWVVQGVAHFLGDDPAHQELMKRLKESGD